MDLLKATLSRKGGDAGDKVPVKARISQPTSFTHSQTIVLSSCSLMSRRREPSWRLAQLKVTGPGYAIHGRAGHCVPGDMQQHQLSLTVLVTIAGLIERRPTQIPDSSQAGVSKGGADALPQVCSSVASLQLVCYISVLSHHITHTSFDFACGQLRSHPCDAHRRYC